MFDPAENSRSDQALRVGLQELPTPHVSADFDARIQAALQPRPPWWQLWWTSARPAFPIAVGTCAAMLLLLHGIQNTSPNLPTAASIASARSATRQQANSLSAEWQGKQPEEAVENIDLTDASLLFFSRPLHRRTSKSG